MSFLEQMVARKRERLKERPALAGAGPNDKSPDHGSRRIRSLSTSLREGSGIIAEIKRRSPSRGALRPDLRVEDLAPTYEEAGASAISVLTEPEKFGGSLEDLRRARQSVELPLLRKDFLLAGYEVEESRRAGADALLLIAAILSPGELSDLLQATTDHGMEALVEIHREEELQCAISAGARLIGINNRDLTTLQVDLDVSRRLLPQIPSECVTVVESGIRSKDEIDEFRRLGASGFLIGEALVTSDSPGNRLRELGEPSDASD
jgi:indole-3-glycerol phosphate synthase